MHTLRALRWARCALSPRGQQQQDHVQPLTPLRHRRQPDNPLTRLQSDGADTVGIHARQAGMGVPTLPKKKYWPQNKFQPKCFESLGSHPSRDRLLCPHTCPRSSRHTPLAHLADLLRHTHVTMSSFEVCSSARLAAWAVMGAGPCANPCARRRPCDRLCSPIKHTSGPATDRVPAYRRYCALTGFGNPRQGG